MRLAIVSLDFAPQVGGVQTYLYEIGQRLGTDHEVVAITPAGGALPVRSAFSKHVVSRAGWVPVLRALRSFGPDVVLVGHAHPRLLLAATLCSARHAVIAHGEDYLAAQQRWHAPLTNAMLRRASPLITVSGPGAARLRQLLGVSARIIRPGVDPRRFGPAPIGHRNGVRLLTVGRLVPRKGVDVVLRAVALLRQKLPDLRYDVVGEGPDRQRLEDLAEQLQLGSAVQFHGAVSDERLPDLYRRADVFVMPVHRERRAHGFEGFGIVYLEASASGLPVVAARSGGAVDAVRDGETGLLVPPEDPEELSCAIRQLAESPNMRRELGNGGREWVENEMNWERVAREIEQSLRHG